MTLTRLGQVKYGGVEVNFRDDLHQAEALARAVPRGEGAAVPALAPAKIHLEAAAGDPAELTGTLVGREASTATTVLVAAGSKGERRAPRTLECYLEACQASPRLGLLEAWDDLNRGLLQASTHLGDRRAPAPVRAEAAVRFLVDRGWLNGVEGQLIDRLRRISDLVAGRQGPPVILDDARRFVELVVPLIQRVAGLI